jgi:L-phenylalanine/L-methionine N-acetyltransferase
MVDVTVRSVLPDDIKDLVEIYSYEEVLANTLQVPHRDAKFWQDFYKIRDPQGVELAAVIDGKAIGHLGMIFSHAPRRKHVATFGICVHPAYHGKGAGRALMAEMINLADNWFNIFRLELGVASENARAIALYEKCGFSFERESRFDNFRAGRYQHTTHMVRFHPAQIALADLSTRVAD